MVALSRLAKPTYFRLYSSWTKPIKFQKTCYFPFQHTVETTSVILLLLHSFVPFESKEQFVFFHALNVSGQSRDVMWGRSHPSRLTLNKITLFILQFFQMYNQKYYRNLHEKEQCRLLIQTLNIANQLALNTCVVDVML